MLNFNENNIHFTDIQRTKCKPFIPSRVYESSVDNKNPFAVQTDKNSRFVVNKFDNPIHSDYHSLEKPCVITEIPQNKSYSQNIFTILFVVVVLLVIYLSFFNCKSVNKTEHVSSLLQVI